MNRISSDSVQSGSIGGSRSTRQTLSRALYIGLVRTALAVGEHRFARQAALAWLSAYPGDLQISLLYAQALSEDGLLTQAIPVLEGLCQADPEFVEAHTTLLAVHQAAGLPSDPNLLSTLLALGASAEKQGVPVSWGRHLWLSREYLKRGEIAQAESLVRHVLGADPPAPLAAVTHLQILWASGEAPLEARRSLAELYHRRWPDCLQCKLLLSICLMEGGEADQAVALLHQAAAGDTGGQAATRLWGQNHAYRALWPADPHLALEVALPAAVAAGLGWNQLPAGKSIVPSVEDAPVPIRKTFPETSATHTGQSTQKRHISRVTEVAETLRPVQEELGRVAKRLNQPGLANSDGRFPVYVVFSLRSGLETQYGAGAAMALELQMKRLVDAVQARPGWGARLFLVDDPACTAPLGIKPVRKAKPWELKLALGDLDSALEMRGEMIGAVLIVGGPSVVPFHYLPNPVDDQDDQVASDNPYGTRDENYFVPEWPVGRLPGSAGQDAAPLMEGLRQIIVQHTTRAQRVPWYTRWWQRLAALARPARSGNRPSLGYTAAAWRQASMSVFRPIGEPRAMYISPPSPANGSASLPAAKLGYFNLHGLVDSAEWYGQRDPVEPQTGPDYPIALRPSDVRNGGRAPLVVFSEACYGAHIQGKNIEQALALKFLSAGSQTVVGSTCMAYGSISTPLIAADLLGQAFWNNLREGLTAGESLQRAKIQLVSEMHRRQGYLDGEDQKTLISFVLYGDPLAQPLCQERAAKRVARFVNSPVQVKTVCGKACSTEDKPQLSSETVAYVKQVVTQYLPGMSDAVFTVCRERAECRANCRVNGQICPTAQFTSKSRPSPQAERRVVVLSKQVERAEHTHFQYARLTLDKQGKMVKLVVSR